MKKLGDRINQKIDLPKNFPWKVFEKVVRDLGDYVDLRSVSHAIRMRDFDELDRVTRNFEPRCMLEAEPGITQDEFFVRYQVRSFLKKYPFKGHDTWTPAYEKFLEAELRCADFNRENHKALLRLNEDAHGYIGMIDRIRKDIVELIGEHPDISYLFGFARTGPGVCLGGKYRNGKVTTFYKFSELPYTVTSRAMPLAKAMIASDPRWIGALDDWYRKRTKNLFGPIDLSDFWDKILVVSEHSELFSVPKTAKIDRFACKEAMLNVMLQLGVDGILRSRLKRWGFDIDSQEKNQKMALEGSSDGTLATLDLSAASDTISMKICELFLPPAWFDLLVDLRADATVINRNGVSELIHLQKLSSMGNGFTFAVETLIFGAVVREAIRVTDAPKRAAVFGDDIIVPTQAAAKTVELLQLCGFSLNLEKSFTEGRFRESCGKDYLDGVLVRPVFVTSELKDLSDVLYVHNIFYGLEESLPWYFDIKFKHTLGYLRSRIPKWFKEFYGPPSESYDSYLFSRKRLEKNQYGQRVHKQIGRRAVVFIRPRAKSSKFYANFFFLKLLASLGRKSPKRFWERRSRDYDRGNAFLVTRRGKVQNFVSERIAVY